MKISSLVALSSNSFLVDERTDTVAKVYRVDISNASNILGHPTWDTPVVSPGASTLSIEGLANPASQGILVLPKTLVADLSALGLPTKIEGISLVRPMCSWWPTTTTSG